MSKPGLDNVKLSTNKWIALLVLSLSVMSLPAQAQDDYLSSLSEEADKTTVLEKAMAEQEKLQKLTGSAGSPNKAAAKPKSASKTKSKPAPKKTASAKKGAKPSAAHKKFETALFDEFPGNYAVYSSLSDSQKKQVFQSYQDASDKEGLMRFGPVLGSILDFASQ
jgi:hypothetical protein